MINDYLSIIHIIKIQCLLQIANVRTASGNQPGSERVEPRFFLWYWFTSTATATTTSTTYTSTKTFTLTVCTPTTNFSYAGKVKYLIQKILEKYKSHIFYISICFFCSLWLIMRHYTIYYGRK